MTATPFLEAWFEIMDSDTPERVLDLITDDFVMSIQFSQGEGLSAEFVGDHAGLVAYLEQREKSVLVHEITHGARVDDVAVARLTDHDVGPVRDPAAAEVAAHLVAAVTAAGAGRQDHHEAHLGVEQREGVVDASLVEGAVVPRERGLEHETELSSIRGGLSR